MTWLELIELRSASPAIDQIEQQLAGLPGPNESPGVEFYRRTLIDGDFLLTICHRRGPVETYGSELGLRLAAALEQHGLVSHSVWTVHDNTRRQDETK